MGRSGENFEPLLDDDRAVLGFTNRFGGHSNSPFNELNLAQHVGDNELDVLKNREVLAVNLDVQTSNLVFMNQTHSCDVEVFDLAVKRAIFDSHNASKAQENPANLKVQNLALRSWACDSIITDQPGFALCVMVADCSPILIYDAFRRVCAAVHAGRAGILGKIFTKTIMKMGEIYGCEPLNLEVFVGPNIKGSCYEIGSLDLGEFERFRRGKNFDLNLALRAELKEAGVKNYHFSEICTHCDERYFSYRRDGQTGRFCGIVMLK